MATSATPQNFQQNVGGYMNPYLQMALAPQLAEANRQYDISGAQQQSNATRSGAFGGSREAIMAAENERNRNTGLSNIIGQGYNTAFGNAQNQYNQSQQQALQGLGVGLQGASTLGQLGQNQYGQQMGINQLQAGYGAQQQAQMQKGLDTSYQDFTNQQNYPYKQLGFMSDMIRGLPLGQQSTSQMYQAPPTGLQTVGALGMGAYGINQLSKYGANGGLMDSYADGGEIKYYAGDQDSVTSSDNIEDIISRLNPQQLQAALKNAQARGDGETVAAITKRLDTLSRQASMTQGIAGAMPEQMADGIVNAAGGGILAFNKRGLVDESDGEGGSTSIELPQYAGDPALYKKFGNRAMSSIDAYSNLEAPRAYTPQEEDALDARSMARAKKLIGPSPIPGIKTELEGLKAEGKNELQVGRGLAALASIEGILQPGGALRGAAKGLKNFTEAYAPAVKAKQDLRRSTTLMNINLANAERAENMGLGKEAMAYTNQAAAAKKEAGKAERELALKEAELNINAAKAFRPPSKGSGAGSGKIAPQTEAYNTYYKYYKDLYPEQSDTVTSKMAMDKALEMKTPGLPGVTARVEATADEKARERTAKRIFVDTAFNEAQRKKDKTGMDSRRAEILAEELAPPADKGSPPPAKGDAPKAGGPTTPYAFNKQWATLKKGQTLVGPDGLTYTKQ
jgi:hypothetical protein